MSDQKNHGIRSSFLDYMSLFQLWNTINPMQDHGTSSEMLSDMLSSRSYLDLSPEQPQGIPKRELGPEMNNEPERSLRPQNKRAPEVPEMTDRLAIKKASAAPDRPTRKRGRPRLETVKDAAAIEVL
jgi:hypothetical protein